MPYLCGQVLLEKNIRVCWYEKAFTVEDCEKIIKDLSKTDLLDAKVSDKNTLELSIRKSKISWHNYNDDNDWIFKKLHEYVQDANNVRWQFNLSAFSEPLQFTKYEADGGHYDYHQDSGVGSFSIRKLSMVLLLSNNSDYEGGRLELFQHEQIPNEQGTLIIFPSFEMHRVTPVTKGERYSLVAWVSGPPYK